MSQRSVPRPSHFTVSPPWELTAAPNAPIVAVLGGISASRHVTANTNDPSPGWWQEVVGPGRTIDTGAYRVLEVDWTVPSSGSVTTHDKARALAAVLDQLGESRLHAIVGSSYGGMVALAFAE